MFSARKLLEPPAKRNSTFLTVPTTTDTESVPFEVGGKRQRLQQSWNYNLSTPDQLEHEQLLCMTTKKQPQQQIRRQRDVSTLDDIEKNNLLVESSACTLTRVCALPGYLCDEIRREQPSPEQLIHCHVSVPTDRNHDSTEDEEVVLRSYYVLVLRQRVAIWQQATGTVVSLSLPDELVSSDRLYPFLFALYGSRVSLMAITSRGSVWFWEDIELPYETLPLSVQMPLQSEERIATRYDATMVVSTDTDVNKTLQSLLCWSTLGNVWEVAMDDRRIRVRTLEQETTTGLLSQWTKSVSHFFFSTASSQEKETRRGGIVMIKIMEEVDNDDLSSETVEMLVLFENGAMECRSFNTVDVMNCTYTKTWQLDTHRIAITFFSERFPSFHLAKVVTMTIAYIDTNTTTGERSFGLVVAYVSTPSVGATPKPTAKYALLHFIDQTSRGVVPEPVWGCVLDHEPLFSESVDPRQYFEVETVALTSSTLYLVWTRRNPIHFASIRLPGPAQTTVQSTAFSLQGVNGNSAFAFGARIEPVQPSITTQTVQASVSFVLIDVDQTPSGLVCAATAANMKSIERSQPSGGERGQRCSRHTKRVVEGNHVSTESRTLAKHQSVQTYARLLMKHFDEQATTTGASSLHVHPQDVANVAQGALAVICEILNAKASSGLRWGKDADQESRQDLTTMPRYALTTMVVTPKLVRYQLEEKRARYDAFVMFLQQRCREVWQFMTTSEEYTLYLVETEEKLYAAISLCKFQATILSSPSTDEQPDDEKHSSTLERKISGALLLRAMERAVEARGYEKEQLRLAGYNAFDMFYCEVSKVDELFPMLRREVELLSMNGGEGNDAFLYGLLESGYSMQSLLHKPPPTKNTQLGHSNGTWMFTRPIREVLADHIAKLSSTCGYSQNQSTNTTKWTPEQVFELSHQIRALGVVLLDAYTRLSATSPSEALEDLMKEAEITKRLVLNAYVYVATCYQPQELATTQGNDDGWQQQHQQQYNRRQNDMFVDAVQLSEQYKYYDAMVYLAFKEDEQNLATLDYITGRVVKSAAARRIETYCHQHTDFAEFLFLWYGGEARVYPWPFVGVVAQSQMFAFLLTNAAVYGPALHNFLKNHVLLHQHCWLTAVSSEKYDHVSVLALEKAREEKESSDMRKTMASIAKIAALSEPTTPHKQTMIAEATRELAVSKIQDVLSQLPLELHIKSEPLGVSTLVERSLEALSLVAEGEPLRTSLFLMAVEALECLPDDVSSAELEEACIRVWQSCILSDELVWVDLLSEYDAGINEQKVEELMRSTLLCKSMVEYVGQFKHRGNHRAGLTVELIDNIVQRQLSTDSIISVSTRQLFVKTLNLALAP